MVVHPVRSWPVRGLFCSVTWWSSALRAKGRVLLTFVFWALSEREHPLRSCLAQLSCALCALLSTDTAFMLYASFRSCGCAICDSLAAMASTLCERFHHLTTTYPPPSRPVSTRRSAPRYAMTGHLLRRAGIRNDLQISSGHAETFRWLAQRDANPQGGRSGQASAHACART